jgi:chromosome segregation ATPase
MIETTNLTGQMEQLQASLEAKDIECVQLMEQMEDIQAAKVRGSQSVSEANETPNGVKQARLLTEAKEEIARLVTKVEELELKTKKLMVYKAAHGFPESAAELKQKVEELQVVLDAEVAKTTRLESSIDTLKGEEQLKAEAHESVVEGLRIAVGEKQELKAETAAYRDRVAQFGEELGTAEQLRVEMDLLVIESKRRLTIAKGCVRHMSS